MIPTHEKQIANRVDWNLTPPKLAELTFKLRDAPVDVDESIDADMEVRVQLRIIDLRSVFALLRITFGNHPNFDCAVAYSATISLNDEVPETECYGALRQVVPVALESGMVPFAREIISSCTTRAGLKPFIIVPIYFEEDQFEAFFDSISSPSDDKTKTPELAE